MHDDVHICSDGRLIYNCQDGCVDTLFCKIYRFIKHDKYGPHP